jgi:hypothetical protein
VLDRLAELAERGPVLDDRHLEEAVLHVRLRATRPGKAPAVPDEYERGVTLDPFAVDGIEHEVESLEAPRSPDRRHGVREDAPPLFFRSLCLGARLGSESGDTGVEEGPVVADRNNHTVEYRRKRSTDQVPTRDPLELELLHGPNSWESEIKSEFVTSVIVRTVSDIWFDDSEIGQANAHNLAAFLERIDQTLPVEKINRASDWLPVEQLEDIY